MPQTRPDLICPRCKLALQRIQTEHGILWACDHCGGRAVGVELLRRTFTPESINPLWLHTINGPSVPGASCPSCENSMSQVAIADGSRIRVDVCRLCHFVWFDATETAPLVPRKSKPAKNAARPLPQKARERLALAKVEQLTRHSAARPEWWQVIAEYFGTPV